MSVKKPSSGELKFIKCWRSVGGTKTTQELKFHPTRKWRFDFAWPEQMVALEVEGGVWGKRTKNGFIPGGHTSGTGYTNNCEKYNEATLLGWAIFRLTPAQINIEMLEKIKYFIENRKNTIDKTKL